jgi:hypothetical protein
MARTHKSLEGTEIVFNNAKWHNVPAIITGCNKDIGISIQLKEDMEIYLYCLICPSAPNFGKGDKEWTVNRYKVIVPMLLKGKLDMNSVEVVQYGRQPSADTCPFSQ